jgi:glycosyltransferase involved in cell wall biosynthesis
VVVKRRELRILVRRGPKPSDVAVPARRMPFKRHLSSAIRLAMVYSTDFENISPGGITTSVRSLIARLDDRFRLVLACVGSGHEENRIRDRVNRQHVTVLPVMAPSRRFRLIPLNLAFTVHLFRKRRQVLQNADLVHAHRMELALPFVIVKKKPVVLTVHGSSKHHRLCTSGLLRLRPLQHLYALVERFVLCRVDAVVLLSSEAARYYRQRYPRQQRKFVVIPNFIDTSEFAPVERNQARSRYGVGDSDVTVVYAGRLSREKRVDRLIASFAKIVEKHPAARLLIAGGGPEEARLRLQATELCLERVRFLGMLAQPDVRWLLGCADVVVLPSEFEGFPMIVLEALACGVPVVAADVGGVRDIMTGDLADFVLQSTEPEEIAEKVVWAADRRERVWEACLTRARQFDVARILPQIEAVYSRIIQK